MPQTPDSLTTYLLIVNAGSLVLHAIDCRVRRVRGHGLVRHVPLDVLTVAGGAAGTLLAYLLFDLRTHKANAWWHVLALDSFIIWAVVVCFRYVEPFDPEAFFSNLRSLSVTLLAYPALVSLATFVCFGVDKRRAVRGAWRIPEATLLGLSLAGGTVGGLCGMLAFRHKIRSPQFAWGLPLMLVAQLALLVFLVSAGILA